MAKLPTDAFTFYAGLGPGRSYQAVADHFGVTKRSVTRRASEDNWQDRLAAIEKTARERTDAALAETIEQVNARHLKILRAIQGRALQAIQGMPLTTGMEGVRALDLAIRQERLILGEPSDRSSVSIEETIKREYETWLKPAHPEHTNGSRLPADEEPDA